MDDLNELTVRGDNTTVDEGVFCINIEIFNESNAPIVRIPLYFHCLNEREPVIGGRVHINESIERKNNDLPASVDWHNLLDAELLDTLHIS